MIVTLVLTLSRAKYTVLPLILIVLMVLYFDHISITELGVPLPKITIEKVNFLDSEILVIVRNTSHIPINIVMADVNDRIQNAIIEPDSNLERFDTASVHIPFEWDESKPYVIGLTTADGIRFTKEIKSAFHSLYPSLDIILLLISLGIYVGIFPILIGLSWLPLMKQLKRKYNFFLSLTVGLLLFLVVDTMVELSDLSTNVDIANTPMMILVIIILTVFGLYYLDHKIICIQHKTKTMPVAVALMISIGIGFHNFGEGVMIGTSINLGELALGSFLIIGFALHNITEGVAIATTLTKEKILIKNIFILLIISGTPTIFGLLIGGFTNSLLANIIFISIGVGSVIYVIITIIKLLHKQNSIVNQNVMIGIVFGICVMYFTSILI